jgi:polyisoprenoid-binding protein YceI
MTAGYFAAGCKGDIKTYTSPMRSIFLLFAALLIATTAFAADGSCVVSGRGHFHIHVGTAGLFGSFAHNHLIEAEKISGCAAIDSQDPGRSSVKLEFGTNGLRVIDPKDSEKDRTEVQKNMESEVLRITEFPKVTFVSTSVEGLQADRYRVHGSLTIRGQTQPAVIPVTLARLDDGTYRASGEYKFKQSSFGIKPIQLAGGTVKVKDELEVEFELFLK